MSVTIDIDTDLVKLLIEDLKSKPRKFRRLYRQRIEALANTTITELRQTPAKPSYPIRWKTAKQRRAFFATKGFGRGIPTRRTGALGRGWKFVAITDFNEGLFEVFNDATTRDYFSGQIVFYEQFVQGVNQQPFHADTGWVRSQDVLADTLVQAEDLIVDTWLEVNGVK